MKSNRIVQTVLIAVFAVCTLFSAFISVLACIPVTTDVQIKETVQASAAPVSAGSDSAYQIDVSGALTNTTGNTLVVERLEIPLEADRGEGVVTVEITNIEIPARSTVTVSKPMIANGAYEKVGEITATVNGERIFLRNPAQTSPTVALIPIAVTAVFAFFLVRSCKIRYYMMQEDRADADEASDKQSE